MKVLKFGGSSIATPKRVEKVISIILDLKDVRAVVFSAFGGVTDNLIEMGTLASIGEKKYLQILNSIENRHRKAVQYLIGANIKVNKNIDLMFKELSNVLHGIFLVKELSPQTLDLIMSFGERLSAFIISEAIGKKIRADFLDTRQIIKTNDNFGNALVNSRLTRKNIKEYFQLRKNIQIVTGFIASNSQGITTTLGRGGSDFTVSLIGASLLADEIQIWTDTDGILTADPRKVEEAFPISNITYEEAMELSHFGAKVIHPPTIQPAKNKKIQIRVKNTFNPNGDGTVISSKRIDNKCSVVGIPTVSNVSLLRMQGSGMASGSGIAKRLFGALAEEKINVILITQASSEHTICFVVKPEYSKLAKDVIEKEFVSEIKAKYLDKVFIENEKSIISIVGEGMRNTIGLAGKFFTALGTKHINIVAIAQGSSERNISVVINKSDEIRALNEVHKMFFKHENELNVFVAGTGTIGGELLNQIKNANSHHLQIQGIMDIDKMVLGNIKFSSWKGKLKRSKIKSDIDEFINFMNASYGKKVFVDCTASKKIVSKYKEILSSGISIVTPNKIANSSEYKLFTELNNLTNNNVKFLYETNVGAGLPVIETLKGLLQTGDKILTIEAVLSGTISYIFNKFKDRKFSEIVKEAKENGYTEPDPRDDLNGLDVARKILILARVAGIKIDLKDVKVEKILSEKCYDAKSIDNFFELLELEDERLENKRKDAERKNKVLRYIATLENGKAKVELKEVGIESPFYSLKGADNMISFKTERYNERPLTIRGPGAGAKVTATGVFADILKVV
ncbi:MAG: bifunctional aspartate kinase/homoserine dehydrogenase I [Candidatus Marinimicrobia bacterium]|nr:bifunctional aspartate kinase/homoserine dehydrogenase I [Candidatus Neomarinimicrobiota bacterium]